MQALRDAATLGILILLALTVRVDLDGKPIDLDIAAPAEASVEQAVAPELRPAFVAEPVRAGQPAPAADDVDDHFFPVVTRHVALPVPPRTVEPGQVETERREIVWEVDGKRVVIVLGGEPPAKTASPSASAPEPCDRTLRARLSC